MLFTPIYIAMTFIKTWRIRSFRARLLEFLNGNTSVAFCKVPENVAETPTLSSKLCTNPKNAYLCDLLDYTNTSRVCSMKPPQCIDINDWVTCCGGMPLGSAELSPTTEQDIEVLFECEMEPHEDSALQNIVHIESIGELVAWKAGTHLAIVLKTNIEQLSAVGFDFISGEFIIDHKLPVVRIQTIQLTGEPNKAVDISMRGLRTDIQHGLKGPPNLFQWPVHAALLRKLSKVVDIKSDASNIRKEMNGNGSIHEPEPARKTITLADVSVNTGKSLTEDDEKPDTTTNHSVPQKSPEKLQDKLDKDVVLENVTVEIQHNITPRKSSLRLDLKKGASSLSTSLLNISSQIKSVTTHKRIVSSTGPKKAQIEAKEECCSKEGTPKSAKISRPLVNTKSPNIVIYSDSAIARDNLEASLRKVLDCEKYTLCPVSRAALAGGAWRGRAALAAVAGGAGAACPLLLAHVLAGGRLLALCSDLLHVALPAYKTAEIRENEVVQFTYDKWKSVKMKHHIFCYQASPAKKQFSTENDRQPSRYTGHPGHELVVEVLASEETWQTPSLLQATDLTNGGIAIFSQVHLEADPSDYLGEEGPASNEIRLQILHKILGDVLGLHVVAPQQPAKVEYTKGYFLGNHVQKLALVEQLCGEGGAGGGEEGGAGARVTRAGPLSVQWCLRGESPAESPSETFLPVSVHECPDNFNTVEYFDNLSSRQLGRLVIYSDVVSSTSHLLEKKIAHGVCVVARRQTGARGRGGNTWLSPEGHAAISLQLCMSMSPAVPLLQYAAALAAVLAVRARPDYSELDIRIKWPNDVYVGREAKLGGVLTTAACVAGDVTVNIGTGVNVCNSSPTTCINDVIRRHNARTGATLRPLSVETYLAHYCTQLERIVDSMLLQGGLDALLQEYYKYWLHHDEEITVASGSAASPVRARVLGLDAAGRLRARTARGDELLLLPDGNTFDMMSGLVAPKEWGVL